MNICFEITLSDSLAVRQDAIDELVRACQRVMPLSVAERSGQFCRVIIKGESPERAEKIIKGAAADIFGRETAAGEVSVVRIHENKAQPKAERIISELVGAEEFKALAEEIVSIAPQIIKYSTQNVFARQSYLFSINDGCGLSTYVSLFAKLVDELGIFDLRRDDGVIEVRLEQKKPADASGAYLGRLAELKRPGFDKKGHIFSIDISEWMGRTEEKDFRELLYMLEGFSQDNIFIFRIPFVEGGVLKSIEESLSDLMFIRTVSFLPLSAGELERCAELELSKHGYSMSESAKEIFRHRIAEEKSDGRFYGINTVHKVACEMIYHKQLSNARSNTDGTHIDSQDLRQFPSACLHDQKTASEELSGLIGMEQTSARVEEIINQIKVSLSGKSVTPPCLHMRFVGNPGTGKTTVARIVGRLLKENGVLRTGGFFEYRGRDFCGRFVGETAPKTAGMCRDAYGSVLFIDEAYSLYRGSGDYHDFGREALDTLIAEMESHRSDMVVIMAGYEDEMETLMQGNIGLESRMPYVIRFPNYTREQLFGIFRCSLEKEFRHDGRVLDEARLFFEQLPDSTLNSKEFSNARFVRNLYERTWSKAAMRSKFSNSSEITVTREDFLQAASEKEFSSASCKSHPVGFR